jgi:hypothetical protein
MKYLLIPILACIATLHGCSTKREVPQAQSEPGDVLVSLGKTSVILEKQFKPGQPNGLFDGVVSVSTSGNVKKQLIEVNAVCSIPSEDGWPDYDNLYGKEVADAKEADGPSGNTSWQILYKFSGTAEAKMGQKPGDWTDRLRDNLCRRGSFDDRKKQPPSS